MLLERVQESNIRENHIVRIFEIVFPTYSMDALFRSQQVHPQCIRRGC